MNFLSKLSFKVKLIALCMFMSAVSVTIGVVSYNGLAGVEKSYERITDETMPNLSNLGKMFLNYRAVRINLRTLGLPGLPKDEAEDAVKKVGESIDNYEAANKAYASVPFVEGEKELYDDLQKNWLHFKDVGARALALYKSGTAADHEKLMKIYFEDCPQAAKLYTESYNKIAEFNERNGKTFVAEAKSIAAKSNQYMMLITAVGVLAGLSFGLIFAILISKTIVNVTDNLTKSTELVTSASIQIASASQELSQASTEQAASLEETAASLEEISAMINKATDSAAATADSSNESQGKAEEGRHAVDQMLTSMGEISQSNEAIMSQIEDSNKQMSEIVKVIQEIGNKTKVINEIVFQTKLLSFNASVEAARAGEHGKGFAVVAEEVGNLAQMSGNAAKEISDMLEGSISRVEKIVNETKTKVDHLANQGKEKVASGVDVANQCSSVLNEIVQNVSKVSTLSQEISQASKEQAQGVAEINKAMSQLDTVTQQNASASEETASAAEKLSSQAEVLRSVVNELVVVIQGSSAVHAPGAARSHQETTHKSNVVSIKTAPKKKSFTAVKAASAKHTEKQPAAESLKKASGEGFTPRHDDDGFRES